MFMDHLDPVDPAKAQRPTPEAHCDRAAAKAAAAKEAASAAEEERHQLLADREKITNITKKT